MKIFIAELFIIKKKKPECAANNKEMVKYT